MRQIIVCNLRPTMATWLGHFSGPDLHGIWNLSTGLPREAGSFVGSKIDKVSNKSLRMCVIGSGFSPMSAGAYQCNVQRAILTVKKSSPDKLRRRRRTSAPGLENSSLKVNETTVVLLWN